MAIARRKLVNDRQEGVFHCMARCVRRAYLYGQDPLTGRSFVHRKAWIVDRLRFLSGYFGIDVAAYAVMDNHFHVILRTRPDVTVSWSAPEVAVRWLSLSATCPVEGGVPVPDPEMVRLLVSFPEKIEMMRLRLQSISWFMSKLDEWVARRANHEDDVRGRFWEGRFKSQVLLDHAAVIACMAYVDLNPVRAGIAESPETSVYTSIWERIRTEMTDRTSSRDRSSPQEPGAGPSAVSIDAPSIRTAIGNPIPTGRETPSWLCPVHSTPERRGMLPITLAEYLTLVDRTGRLLRKDKRGAMDPDLAPILTRLGANPDGWTDTVGHFRSRFCLVVGVSHAIQAFSATVGHRWMKGLRLAKASFIAPSP